MKAKCHVVADQQVEGRKVGEEVRFYAVEGGAHVKTIHLEQADFGKYVEGQEYDVEPDDPEAHKPQEPPADGGEELTAEH